MGEKDRLNISGSELRASAAAADVVGRDMAKPLRTARSDAESAAASMLHWQIGKQLKLTAESWADAVDTLLGKLGTNADALRDVAREHKANEHEVLVKFVGWAG